MIPDRNLAKASVGGANEEELAKRPKELAKVDEMANARWAWPLTYHDDLKLSKVAPAFIQVCQFDLLRDQGLLYYNRLQMLGVPTMLSFLQNAVHTETLNHFVSGERLSKAAMKGLTDIVNFIEHNL